MLDLSRHPYFEEYTDENTGVKSYILKEKVTRLQLNFYFNEQGLTEDNKYLWIKCIDYPAPNHHLAVVSLDPHPSFSHDGKNIVSMTTVRGGKVDVAITPVEPLLKLCREKGVQINN